ncbi:MAG: permease [Chloroflexi bacterium]|nr:permease [Chloroflexota bacterium]
MQANPAIGRTQEFSRTPASYQWKLAALVASLGLMLLTLVDARRAFLFPAYAWKTPYFSLGPWHLAMATAGILGIVVFYRSLKSQEGKIATPRLEGYVKWLTFIIFGMFIIDAFTYRGVAAARAAEAGKVGVSWLNAYGVTGWLKPLALAVSYQLTVWHATFLGVMLAGLALTVLPRYLKPMFARTGLGGSLFGAAFALPQPFCSCCASVISPSLARQGASKQFLLAFVVGSPMLNLTALVLAALLLPAPYAILRVAAGLLLTLPVTFGVAWVASRWEGSGWTPRGPVGMAMMRLMNGYCRLFQVDELVKDRRMDTPAAFIGSWLSVSRRIAVLLVPTLFVLGMITSALVQVLPAAFGNNLASVGIAAVAGTVFMVSTWSEIPMAQQMLQAGFNGPAATLLVVLPPVSLPCLMLLGGALANMRMVALLGVTVAVVGFIAGVAFL